MFGFLAKLWPNIRPYLGLLKYLIVSLDRSPILLRVISWLHKVANYFKWILSIPNNQLTFSQRSECKLEESVYDKWLLTIFVSSYPPDPPSSPVWRVTVCSQGRGWGWLIMGIRRQIINASISLHYQIGRLVAGINVAWKSNKNALNIFLSKPIILSRRCVNKTNVDTNTLLSRTNLLARSHAS